MFHQGGAINTYNYDWARGGRWGDNQDTPRDSVNPIYFNSGNWYNITQRVVMNTFTDGVANADGLNEYWVDGRLIYRETGLKCHADRRGGHEDRLLAALQFLRRRGDPASPLRDCYGYFDNISVWLPDSTEDPYVGDRPAARPHISTLPTIFCRLPIQSSIETVVYDTLSDDVQGTVQEFSNITASSYCDWTWMRLI